MPPAPAEIEPRLHALLRHLHPVRRLTTAVALPLAGGTAAAGEQPKLRLGVIGLDSSHGLGFAEELNTPAGDHLGATVVACVQRGTGYRNGPVIAATAPNLPQNAAIMESFGVPSVDTVAELLDQVDGVFLTSWDGRVRLDQAMEILRALKPMFMDKPIAANMPQCVDLQARKGDIIGAVGVSPCPFETEYSPRPDLFHYGVHGVEIMYTMMGTGCVSVARTATTGACRNPHHSLQGLTQTDVCVGTWADGRIGTFRGSRNVDQAYGGAAFTSTEAIDVGNDDGGYEGCPEGLLAACLDLFRTGVPPVSCRETLEIYGFMSAAQESKDSGGIAVNIEWLTPGMRYAVAVAGVPDSPPSVQALWESTAA